MRMNSYSTFEAVADLQGIVRTAKCGCGQERPSDKSLPFFEDLSLLDRGCGLCGYYAKAHDLWSGIRTDGVMAGKWPAHIAPHDFVAKIDGSEFDRFYCGCRGWD